MKVSVCIAHHNEANSLLYTVMSFINELHRRDIDHEIIIADNNSEGVHKEYLDRWFINGLEGAPVKIVNSEKMGTVPTFQRAAKEATGDILLFSDQHILVGYDYFDQQLPLLSDNTPLVYARCGFYNWPYLSKDAIYHSIFSTTDLREHFSGKPSDDKPYAVLASQLGAPMVLRKHFEEIGGFGSCYENVGGYGAEELMLPIKTNMFGKIALFNPNTCYIHASVPRGAGGSRRRGDSLCVTAYALGGEEYFNQIYDVWKDEVVATREELIADAKPEYEFLKANAKKGFFEAVKDFGGGVTRILE